MNELDAARLGHGDTRVIAVHDWLGDHRNYEPMHPYLNEERFSWAFVDLRGYGLSKQCSGAYSLEEASADVLRFADSLGWDRFHIVGHSMSSLVAQNVVATAPDRVERMALLTPLSPGGLAVGSEVVRALETMGSDPSAREAGLAAQWGDRNGKGWMKHKLERWRTSATPAAASGYVKLFCSSAFEMPVQTRRAVLAITGAHDGAPFLRDAVSAGLEAFYPQLKVREIAVAGHYPMEEAPVATAHLLSEFFAG